MTDFGSAHNQLPYPFPPGPSTLPRRQMFQDRRLDTRWRRDGYVIIDAFDDQVIGELSNVLPAVYIGDSKGFHSTLQSPIGAYRQKVFDVMSRRFRPLAEKILVDCEAFAASLTVKWPGEDSGLGCHQDWTMVDEFEFRTVNIWLPLVSTDSLNGALRVLPGSHRSLDHLRCSPSNPHQIGPAGTDLSVEDLELLPLQLGQAVVFDLGVLHGSGPNQSDLWRPAITVAYKPREATLLHHFLPSSDSDFAEVYEVDPGFYTEFAIGQRPQREVARSIPYFGTARTREELLREGPDFGYGEIQVRDSNVASRREVDLGESEDFHPVLRDPVLDEEFARRGFVVVDLLDGVHLEELRRLPTELFRGEPRGMHASNMCNDHEYRHEVYRRVAPILLPAVDALLHEYEPCTAVMLLKFPDGDSEFIPHQDWNLVDETRFRSLNVWCPMIDVSSVNGAMSFLPGSHRALKAVRCDPWYPEDYEPQAWKIGYEHMETVELRAGQAVLFDNATLHASARNESDAVRPAVVLVMKPKAAHLLHWYRPDPESHELQIFNIDSDFLADFEMGLAPDQPLMGSTTFTPDNLSVDEILDLSSAISLGSNIL